jgi:hypothetical protein
MLLLVQARSGCGTILPCRGTPGQRTGLADPLDELGIQQLVVGGVAGLDHDLARRSDEELHAPDRPVVVAHGDHDGGGGRALAGQRLRVVDDRGRHLVARQVPPVGVVDRVHPSSECPPARRA